MQVDTTDTTLLGRAITRRLLLQAGGAATVALWLGLDRTARAGAATQVAPAHLRRSSYLGLTGQDFDAGEGVSLRLADVVDLDRAAGDRSLEGSDAAFSLTFRGSRSQTLDQGVHVLRHPRVGAFEMFLVPVGLPGSVQRYEAVIDRLTKPPSSRSAPRGPERGELLLRVSVRSRRSRVVVDLRFASDALAEVLVELRKGRAVRARGTGRVAQRRAKPVLDAVDSRGRSRGKLRPPRRGRRPRRERRPIKAGTYDVVVTMVAKDRTRSVVRRSLKLA